MPRYIDADKLRKTMSDAYWDENIHSAKDDPCVIDAMIDWSIRKVKDAPTEDVVPVIHARWKGIKYLDRLDGFFGECSNCGMLGEIAIYCMHCGAIMDEGVEE